MSDNLNSLVSNLNQSITDAVSRLQAQQQAQASSAESVEELRKDVRKSATNTAFQATDIGILARNTTRLNVISSLNADDPADFYKFKVTSSSETTLGQVGDEGLRVQVQSKLGVVVADSNKDAGDNYGNFQKLQRGELTLDRGDYVLRVSREKGESPKEAKNYAISLSQGSFTKDFDTVAKQPVKGESDLQLSTGTQAMLSGLTAASQNMASIPTGQTGTQKLLGSVFSGTF